ncbi:MAG: hypothetical protein ACI4KD_05085 [Oscillospiraceae bacterium]
MTEEKIFDPTLRSNVITSNMFMTKDRSRPYAKRVSNSYTGTDRIISAATMWELDVLVGIEEKNQREKELRKHIVEISGGDEASAAEIMTKKVEKTNSELSSLIAHTLEIDDRLDWDKQIITDSFEEFIYPFPPQKKAPEQVSGIVKFFAGKSLEEKANEEYAHEMDSYISTKKEAIRGYLIEKEKFNTEKRRHNAEIKRLKKSYENGERSAVEKYSNIILANSSYPENFKPRNEISFNPYTSCVTVNMLFCGFKTFPDIMRYDFVIENKTVTEVRFPPDEKYKRYEKALLTAALRSVHELFEANYNGAVDKIILNGFVPANNNTMNGFISGAARCVFAFSAEREQFEQLKLSDNDYEDALCALKMKRVKHQFTNETELIKPLCDKE